MGFSTATGNLPAQSANGGASPAAHGLLLWNADVFTMSNSTQTPAAATIYLAKIMVPVTTIITNLACILQTAGTSYSNAQMGLYNSAGVLLDSTVVQANTGPNGFGVTGLVTLPLGAPQTIIGSPTAFVWVAFHAGVNNATAIILSSITDTSLITNAGAPAATAMYATQTGHATNNLATIGNLTPSSNTLAGTAHWMGAS